MKVRGRVVWNSQSNSHLIRRMRLFCPARFNTHNTHRKRMFCASFPDLDILHSVPHTQFWGDLTPTLIRDNAHSPATGEVLGIPTFPPRSLILLCVKVLDKHNPPTTCFTNTLQDISMFQKPIDIMAFYKFPHEKHKGEFWVFSLMGWVRVSLGLGPIFEKPCGG